MGIYILKHEKYVQFPYAAACLAITNYQSIGFAFHLSRCLVTSVLYIDGYTLTLVCRFLAVSIGSYGRS